MCELFIDIGTYSPANLAKAGVYPYAEHADFDILLFGHSIDGGPVEVVDLANGEQLPGEVLASLAAPAVVKWAFNAAFERVCLSAWLTRRTRTSWLGSGSCIRCSGTAPWSGLPTSVCR